MKTVFLLLVCTTLIALVMIGLLLAMPVRAVVVTAPCQIDANVNGTPMVLVTLTASPTPTSTPTRTATATFTPRPTWPSPTRIPSSTPRPIPSPATYIVQSGDTLIGIANKFGLTLAELRRLNPQLPADARLIRVGMEVKLK